VQSVPTVQDERQFRCLTGEGAHPANRHVRKATPSPDDPDSRWRVYEYDELTARDKARRSPSATSPSSCCRSC
jgi:hypothetical protein